MDAPKQKEDSDQRNLDATIGFDQSTAGQNSSSTPVITTKQDRDLAFASALLRSGELSERQLSDAISDWTTHGVESLADHLEAESVITPPQRAAVEQRATSMLERLAASSSRHEELTTAQQQRLRLSRLDRNGTLARLLGIADDSSVAAEDNESRQVGARYTLLRKLGQGGLGTVWLARDENLRRYVAVKEIADRISDDESALVHFRREAEVTGRLEHPGIVPIYQFGTDEHSGRAFYAMRFLGKRTLHDAIQEYHERREAGRAEPILMHRLLTGFVNLCQAVAHAHSRRVIHRDLKPDNIALDGFGQVVLLDWGLSKINDETGMYEVDGRPEPGDLHDVGLTHAGRVLGTPLYMAPEQAAGRLDEVDERTDVFGLGGILYAILTGVAPHEATAVPNERSGKSDVFTSIVSEPITAPEAIIADVPPELNAVCMKALSKKRYLRYESASALAEDVQRYMAGTAVQAYHAPIKRRITRFMATHPTLSQIVLLMITLLIIGGATVGYTARQARLALRQVHFRALEDFGRELEVNLQFETRELIEDVRFISELPLMQALIASQNSATGVSSDPPNLPGISSFREVSAAEWLERQGTVFDGMIRVNAAHLVILTAGIDGESVRELVRTERLAVNMPASRVPESRLISGLSTSGMTMLENRRPGQVVLMTGDQLEKYYPTQNNSPLVLIGVSPVFDAQTGGFFGINAIGLDLRKPLGEMMLAAAPEGVAILVTDPRGTILIHFEDGQLRYPAAVESIIDQHSPLKRVFGEDATESEYGDDRSIYAKRVALGPGDSEAEIGIVAISRNR